MRKTYLFSLYLPTLLFDLAQGLLVPIVPLFFARFEVSYSLIGGLLGAEALGTLLADLPVGMLHRKIGTRTLMLTGALLVSLASASLFWAGTIPVMFLLRVVSGVGRAMFYVSRHSYLAQSVPAGVRGRVISLLGGVSRMANFAGPALGGTLAVTLELRAPFLLAGGASFLSLVFLIAFVARKEWGEPTGPALNFGDMLGALKSRSRVLTAAGSGQMLAQMLRTGRATLIPLYASNIVGLDVQAIELILSLSTLVDSVLFYPAGMVMDRFGRRAAIIPSFIIQAFGLSLIPFAHSFMTLAAAGLLIGLGNGMSAGTMMTLGADLAPREARGEFLGVWRFIGDMGFMGGPLLSGWIADLFVLPVALWMLAASGLGSALIFLFFVPETLRKTVSPAAAPSSGQD